MPHKVAAVYCLGLAGVGIVGSLVATAFVARRGYQPARFFLMAWGAMLLGAVTLILRNFQVLPVSPITTYGLQIGIALGVLLLSFSLASRIRTMKEEKKRVEREDLWLASLLSHRRRHRSSQGRLLTHASISIRAGRLRCRCGWRGAQRRGLPSASAAACSSSAGSW